MFKPVKISDMAADGVKGLSKSTDAARTTANGTNAAGKTTARGKFRKATLQNAWDQAEDGSTGGKLCPSCRAEVKVPPNSGARRDWDASHNPSWTNRTFPGDASRRDVLDNDNYNDGVSLEFPGCNRSGGNNDERFRK
ncbi:hypothetical protein GCM10009718_04870 [Isoptericola halotolerans]